MPLSSAFIIILTVNGLFVIARYVTLKVRGATVEGKNPGIHHPVTVKIPLESEFSRECGPGMVWDWNDPNASPPESHEETPANNCDRVLINDSLSDDYMSICTRSRDSSLLHHSLNCHTTDCPLRVNRLLTTD